MLQFWLLMGIKWKLFLDKTSCSYPINVVKEEGSVVPGPDEKLHFGEKVSLQCDWDLEMYTFESGVYRFVAKFLFVCFALIYFTLTLYFNNFIGLCNRFNQLANSPYS